MSKCKWLCVVNLVGVHGPFKVTLDESGRYWDRKGQWDSSGKQEMRDGCWRYAFDSERDARIWVQGAEAVSKAMRLFFDSSRG